MKPKQEKIFDASVWLFVIAAHTVGLSAMWQSKSAEVTIGASVLEIVDLGNFQAGVAEQPEPPAAKVKPVLPEKTKPVKPIKPIEKKIVAVKKPNQKADIVVKKEEIKPEIKPEPQKTVTEEKHTQKAIESSEKNSTNKGSGAGHSGENTGGNVGAAGQGVRQGSAIAPTQASHIGGHLHNPKPPYPQRSIENGEEGAVRLRVRVEANGRPSKVDLVKSSGYPALDRSALKTVREQYRFTPATKMGVAVASDYVFSIKFELP